MKNELRSLTSDLAAHLKTLDEDLVDCVRGQKAEGGKEKTDSILPSAVCPLPSGAEPVEDEMKKLAEEVDACRKCSLGRARLKAVFGVGSFQAEVVFIGEGPGYEEDHRGEPFVGRSGKLLDKILETTLGLTRDKVYIANIVKCHPMKDPEHPDSMGNDRPPEPEEIAACRPYLEKQLALIKPRCVVTLGSVAAKLILGETRGISLLRGKWYDYPSGLFGSPHHLLRNPQCPSESGKQVVGSQPLKVLPTYHPAALLRNPNLKRDTWEDMKMLKAFLDKPAVN